MPELINSQRRIPKATYVPLIVPPKAQEQSGRAVEKAAFLRSLNLHPVEVSALASVAEVRALTLSKTVPGKSAESLIDVVRDFVGDGSPAALQNYGPALARAKFSDFAVLGNAVVRARQDAASSIRTAFAMEGGGKDRSRHATDQPSATIARALSVYAGMVGLSAVAPSSPASGIGRPAAADAATMSPAIADVLKRIEASASQTKALVEQLQYQTPITPVGQIHLERLEMTPVGVEHGELVHSIPLTPGETVNVTHREWSVTTQTFENLTQDSFDGFSETGVTSKTDLAQAADLETKHSSNLDVNGSVSASYNGGAYSLTASAAVAYGTKDETQQSEKSSIAHSMATTRTASARTKKEHKTSFRVSSVAGAEDLAVQVITNKSATQAMRVDYYQLLRKWRVDLIRYGLRMTYDIAIPNPGYGLVAKVMELDALKEIVVKGNTFSLDPTAINRGNWEAYEKDFGASVDPPPVASIELMQVASIPQQTYDKWGAGTIQFDVPEGYVITKGHFRGLFALYSYAKDGRHLQVDIFGEPNGTTNTPTGEFEGPSTVLDFDLTDATLVNHSGSVSLVFEYHNVDFGEPVVRITAEPTDETIQAWRNKVWSQLRQADQANYEARVALARDRQAKLEAEIAAYDALTLRKMEREEIMQGVLRWLLGPAFALMPASVSDAITGKVDDTNNVSGTFAYPDVSELPLNDWQTIMQHGELIKYLHNAIEWENVIFFTYPYFWDRVENWAFKRFLMHPNSIHRDFIRGGYARVVIPVRPGFEVSFAMLMETGDATAAPDTSFPYVTVGEETRNFAMTNYEGIPPANPDHNVRTLLYPQQRRAWADIQTLMRAIAQFYADNGQQYPTNLADPGLAAAALKAGVVLPGNDPWGNAYAYQVPGVFGDYDLASHGTTAQPNVDGLDSDITSWAEGSIVGRWYEYTPTSALDVAVTMIPVDQTPLKSQPQPA